MPDEKDESGSNCEVFDKSEAIDRQEERTVNGESGTDLSSSSDDLRASGEQPLSAGLMRSHQLSLLSCVCPTHEGLLVVDHRFNLSANTVFQLAFNDSAFFRRLLEERKTENLSLSEWKDIEENDGKIVKMRSLSYSVFVNHALAKYVSTIETQYLLYASPESDVYTIRSEAVSSGVPYSDTFSVRCVWCITRGGTENECHIKVHAHILHKKSLWGMGFMKSLVEKNAIEGVNSYCQHFVKALQKWSQEKSNYENISSSDKSSNDLNVGNPSPPLVVHRKTPLLEEHSKDSAGSVSLLPTASSIVNNEENAEETFLLKIILIILLMLLLLNVLLYTRLLQLESAAREFDTILHKSLENASDASPEALVAKWRKTILNAINLVKSMEKNLGELKDKLKDEF